MSSAINLYGNRNVEEGCVHVEDYAVIRTAPEPECLDREMEKGMNKSSIWIEPSSPRYILGPQSRLNYAKVYTAEYNVKVWFISKFHAEDSEQVVVDDNNTHPPLQEYSAPRRYETSRPVRSQPGRQQYIDSIDHYQNHDKNLRFDGMEPMRFKVPDLTLARNTTYPGQNRPEAEYSFNLTLPGNYQPRNDMFPDQRRVRIV